MKKDQDVTANDSKADAKPGPRGRGKGGRGRGRGRSTGDSAGQGPEEQADAKTSHGCGRGRGRGRGRDKQTQENEEPAKQSKAKAQSKAAAAADQDAASGDNMDSNPAGSTEAAENAAAKKRKGDAAEREFRKRMRASWNVPEFTHAELNVYWTKNRIGVKLKSGEEKGKEAAVA